MIDSFQADVVASSSKDPSYRRYQFKQDLQRPRSPGVSNPRSIHQKRQFTEVPIHKLKGKGFLTRKFIPRATNYHQNTAECSRAGHSLWIALKTFTNPFKAKNCTKRTYQVPFVLIQRKPKLSSLFNILNAEKKKGFSQDQSRVQAPLRK